ncbi:MAG: ABC transporter ATP-binding protein [Betaproteobacteria bacterium]|nr:ABC transporter ATP-binding protein [Betaproteobacteria bacterium]
MSSLLEIDRLSRHFHGLRAVDEVSFGVNRGELVGLIGPNGAGKTTVFNCIAGTLAPTLGELRFDGARITGFAPERVAALGIARTFQNLRVFPDITVYDNVSVGAIGRAGVSFAGALLPFLERGRTRRIADSTSTALERFGLAAHAGTLAGNLSYGQKKLLEIARALALEPKLLLLDEPAAGLNGNETEALAVLVRDLRDAGLTILLVEHDMPMVMRVCDRIVVLDSGRLIADGAPAQVRADAAVRAAYLGDDS